MSELDLDELDQAVSKLMDDAGKPKAKKEPTTSVPTPVVTKDDDGDNAVPVSVRSSSPAQATPITPRKKGIAMDIVQPKATTVSPPSARAGRTAPTLQPTQPVTPEPASEKPTEKKPADEPAEVPTPSNEPSVSDETLASLNMQADSTKHDNAPDDDTVHKSAFPDPLDVHGFKDEPSTPKDEESDVKDKDEDAKPEVTAPTMEHHAVVEPTKEEEAEVEKAKEESDEQEEAAKEPGSPFLPTKVEKRPLGAYTDSKPVEDETDDAAKPSDTSSISLADSPKELSPEVVAVESSEPEFTPEAADLPEPEEVEETKEPVKEEGHDMNNLRQMSIPQQYHAEEKAPSQDERPIFDTKQYHTPLEIPATTHHSSSKAGTIFTLILILLVVAAAVVAYFMVTGNVDLSRLF